MNLNLKRALIRAVIITMLILILIIEITVKAGTEPQPPTEETTQAIAETTHEPQETTEPTEIQTEETTPTEESMPPQTTTEPPMADSTEPPTEPEPTYTQEELEMLAIVIYQEAGADYISDETRLMVGTVVMNRIQDERFPDTMHGVLTQKSQYGHLHWTGVVWPDRASYPSEAHAVERAYTIAERILNGERALPEDVVFQSEYIQGEIVAQQDGFYFCR